MLLFLRRRLQSLIIALVAVQVFLFSFWLVNLINVHIPEPYMDEEFHVNQFNAYCNLQWDYWDPHITTPFGLYLASLGVTHVAFFGFALLQALSNVTYWLSIPIRKILTNCGIGFLYENYLQESILLSVITFSEGEAANSVLPLRCFGVDSLRLSRQTNAMFLAVTCIFVWLIVEAVHEEKAQTYHSNLSAYKTFWRVSRVLRVVTIPTHFFYYFLYYTDGLSLSLILGCYCFILKGSPNHDYPSVKQRLFGVTSGLFGCLAICVRQTNVVWVLGIASIAAWNLNPTPRIVGRLIYPLLPPKKLRHYFGVCIEPVSFQQPSIVQNITTTNVAQNISNAKRAQRNMFFTIFGYVILHILGGVCLFLYVIIFNNGKIALGHQEYHSTNRHYTQILYLLLFIFAHMGPVVWLLLLKSLAHGILISYCRPVTQLMYRGTLSLFIVVVIMTTLTRAGVQSPHPFVVSDNRHYVFYIWRRCLQYECVRLWILPIFTAFLLWAVVGCILRGQPVFVLPLSLSISHTAQSNNKWSAYFYLFIFAVCSVFTIVPVWLIEPRYFTIPLVISVIHTSRTPFPKQAYRETGSNGENECAEYDASEFVVGEGNGYLVSALCELLCVLIHMIINAVVFFVFIYKPFTDSNGNLSRFMY